MLDNLPIVLAISTAFGFLAGIGVGGGSLLILWLTLVLHMSQNDARVLNLLFFLPTAIISSLFRWRQGSLKIKKILPAIITGCAAAAVGVAMSRILDVVLLKRLFGGLLLITGVKELLYKKNNQAHQ